MHTRELDTFHALPSPASLPPSITAHLNPRHQTRVRVTTDQKSGKMLKKIVKARIADLNVYSPGTAFDWRVSVSAEMPYTGDGADGEGTDGRAKDRLSYRHGVYQVDLTQVSDVSSTRDWGGGRV